VVKINFRGGKNQLFPLCHAQISVPSTRARLTLSFDWLAFAVKLVYVGSCTREMARVPNWFARFGTAYQEAVRRKFKVLQVYTTQNPKPVKGGHRQVGTSA